MEETKIYRPILKKSWQIMWQFKSLWFLGFFAALISSGGEFELLTRIIFDPTSDKGFMREVINSFKLGLQNTMSSGTNLWSNLWTLATDAPVNIVAAILVLLVALIITVFIIWLTTVSQIGLIRNIALATKNKVATINDGIDAGVENFWTVFLINFIYKIILLTIFIILGQEIVYFVFMGNIGTLIHVILLVIFSIISVFISFLVRYQILHIILKKESLTSSFKSAGKLFKDNWLLSLEMAFILFIIYIITIYVMTFITAMLLAVPVVFTSYSSTVPTIVLIVLIITCTISIIALTLLVTAWLSVFQWSAWIILFNQMSAGKTVSKIVKFSDQSPNIANIFRKK